jgi:hypothetical protein
MEVTENNQSRIEPDMDVVLLSELSEQVVHAPQNAEEWASKALELSEIRAFYQQQANKYNSTAYECAVKDYRSVPVIQWFWFNPSSPAECRFFASEDYLVIKTRFEILDHQENVVETGFAVKGKDDQWQFTLPDSLAEKMSIRIQVYDLPGNQASIMIQL